MLLQEGESPNVLAGGFDELTEENYEANRFENIWKKPIENILDVFNTGTPGVIPGESAAFFLLSAQKSGTTYARLRDVQSFFNPGREQLIQLTENMLAGQELTPGDIDVVLAGFNGDPENDMKYHEFFEALFPKSIKTAYKHLSGEHETASAFAMWCAASMLKEQQVPEIFKVDKQDIRPIKNILLYNFNFKLFNNHTFILLSL
jgi:3-oxoacyl-(acyl-carrier-protein) synthase